VTFLGRVRAMLDHISSYEHVKALVDASQRERERKRRERADRWRRLREAENTVRAVELQYRVKGRLGDDINGEAA
jgi:hypothetical protein